jgi:hypothetical protein
MCSYGTRDVLWVWSKPVMIISELKHMCSATENASRHCLQIVDQLWTAGKCCKLRVSRTCSGFGISVANNVDIVCRLESNFWHYTLSAFFFTNNYTDQKILTKRLKSHLMYTIATCFNTRTQSSGNPVYKDFKVPAQQTWFYVNKMLKCYNDNGCCLQNWRMTEL